MSANLILGASHAMVLARQVGRFEGDWKVAVRDLIPIATHSGADTSLLFSTNNPTFLELKPGPGGEIAGAFGPLMDKVRAFNRPGAKVVLGVGGNEHNIRFLAAHPQPFDVFHPVWPGVESGRQIIPRREMTAVMQAMLERTLTVTRLIAAELPLAERWYLPPPPPIPSEAHIRANTEGFFKFEGGVEAASVRLKLHAIYLEIVTGFCRANGLRLIPPAAGGQDDQGFLREPYWQGSTHATSDYYAGIVGELGL